MSEFVKLIYNFNDRFKINDIVTDPTEYALTDVDIMDTVAINTEEPRSTDVGIIDYGTALGKGTAVIPVMLYASTIAKMNELIQDFKEAFNPDLLEADVTYGLTAGKDGYMPMKWTETVGSTSRDFMTFLKSTETPKVNMDPMAGTVRTSQLNLKAQDPRKYLQASVTVTNSGTATNAGTFTAPVEITITTTGTTSTSLTITNTTRTEAIVVSTALTLGQSLVIDTRLHSVKLNGVEHREYLSAASKWMLLSPGNNVITVANGTNCSVATKFYSAWPL